MWLDERLEFCDATALDTSGTGTLNVGDVADLNLGRDIGMGHPMYVVFQVTTALTSGGSATVTFTMVSDATGTLATDGTQSIHIRTDDFAVADLVQGFTIVVPLPMGDAAGTITTGYQRFLGFQQVVGTASLTAGAVNVFLTPDPHGWTSYPDANN